MNIYIHQVVHRNIAYIVSIYIDPTIGHGRRQEGKRRANWKLCGDSRGGHGVSPWCLSSN
jgi:hypothetical protein